MTILFRFLLSVNFLDFYDIAYQNSFHYEQSVHLILLNLALRLISNSSVCSFMQAFNKSNGTIEIFMLICLLQRSNVA